MSTLAALCASAGALLTVAPAAQAACYSSIPAAASFADSPFDGSLAPEISTVSLALDAACTVSMNPGIDALVGDDAVFTYINRDGNGATGSPSFSGADIVVGTLGEIGADYPPILGTWNGVEFTFTDSTPVGPAPSLGGFAAHVDRLGLTPGATIGVRLGTIWRGTYDYVDFAPEPGASSIPLAVNFTTAPPPPPPPPPPPAPPTPVSTPVATPVPQSAPTEADETEGACTVPKVKGRTRAAAENRLFDADCEVAFSVVKRYSNSVRKGRVIGTSPGTGATTGKRVKLIVSKGRKRARARASSVSPSLLERLEALANAPAR